MVIIKYAMATLVCTFVMFPNMTYAEEIDEHTYKVNSQCNQTSNVLSGPNYIWRLTTFSKVSNQTISINLIIQNERGLPESKSLKAPFKKQLDNDFKQIVISKSDSKNWYFALQRIRIDQCNKETIMHELSSVEPLVIFRHADVSTVEIIPSPNKNNFYSVDIRKTSSGMSQYTYPYNYCADVDINTPFKKIKNETVFFSSIVNQFYCKMKLGKESRLELLDRINFPVKYSVAHTEGIDSKKISKDEFLELQFCCGNVRPTIKIIDNIGYFHRDKYGSGEGEELRFEFDARNKKWYLSEIRVNNY